MSAFSGTLDVSTIKEAVCAYVDAMKQRGVTVEHIMIDIKHAAEHDESALVSALKQGDYDAYDAGRRLLDRALTWCVDHYYWTERAAPQDSALSDRGSAP